MTEPVRMINVQEATEAGIVTTLYGPISDAQLRMLTPLLVAICGPAVRESIVSLDAARTVVDNLPAAFL